MLENAQGQLAVAQAAAAGPEGHPPLDRHVDDATAKKLMKTYAHELNETYVGYSGGTALDTQGDYVRIDGPGVWIEFVCQNGLVFQGKVHYHTVYRDHTRDYGSEFTFS
jgi:hypothetical protein